MKVNLTYQDVAIQERLLYVIDFINNHPLNPELEFGSFKQADISITYGASNTKDKVDYQIVKQNLLFSGETIQYKDVQLNSYKHKENLIYSVELDPNSESNVFIENQSFNFDIFEAVFFHISRYEEYFATDQERNEWDSLIEKNHALVKHQLEKIPVVDKLLTAFFEIISNKTIRHNTKLVVSHDIDHIEKFNSVFDIFKKTIGFVYRRKQLSGLSKLFSDYYNVYFKNGKDPYDNFDWLLIDTDNFDKLIYFLVGGKHKVDNGYNTNSPVFLRAIKLALSRNYKIGIHPSYLSWRDENLLSQEIHCLEQFTKAKTTHSRQHYLHYDLRQTSRLLEDAGIKTDSSIGYNRYIGFRAGTGFNFRLYDFENETSHLLEEQPLIFMDSSCLHEAEMDGGKFIALFESFFEQNMLNTQITCNFHNSFFDEAVFRSIDMKTMYLRLVESFNHKP